MFYNINPQILRIFLAVSKLCCNFDIAKLNEDISLPVEHRILLSLNHSAGLFLCPNPVHIYTAALSIKIHALRGIFFEFSDGIMAAVFLPITLNSKKQ